MKLLHKLESLKSNRKKLIKVLILSIALMVAVDGIVVYLLFSSEKHDSNSVDTIHTKIKTDQIDTVGTVEPIIENVTLEYNNYSDSVEVSTSLNYVVNSLRMGVELSYVLYPKPEQKELERLVSLFNYKFGSLLEINGTDRLSISSFEHDFNLFLQRNKSKYPYSYEGVVTAKIIRFRRVDED